ncbi:hypothetical protein ACJJTC_005660 [Scirpophaga incertulas]
MSLGYSSIPHALNVPINEQKWPCLNDLGLQVREHEKLFSLGFNNFRRPEVNNVRRPPRRCGVARRGERVRAPAAGGGHVGGVPSRSVHEREAGEHSPFIIDIILLRRMFIELQTQQFY